MHIFLRFLKRYAAPFWPWYLLGLVTLYGTNQLTVLIPRFIKEALDAFAAGDAAVSQQRIWMITGAAAAIIVIRTTSRLCFFNPGRAAEFLLRNHLFAHLIRLPKTFHDRNRVGDMMSRATNDLQNVRALIGFAGLQILEAAFILPLTIHQMVILDPGLTGNILILLGVALAVLLYGARAVVPLTRKNLDQLAGISDHVLDTFTAIPAIQGFCAEDAFQKKLERLNSRYVENTLQIAVLRSFVLPLVTLIGSLGVAVVLWQGGRMVHGGTLTVGSIVAFSGYIAILGSRLMAFGWSLTVIQRGRVSLERIYALLDTSPDLPPETALMPQPLEATVRHPLGYSLEVRDLTFTYPGSEDRGPSLEGISFRLSPGQTLGIFGHTGCGKTTLVNLLARVYTPPTGSIFLNGTDVRDIPLREFRDLIALVPQDSFLFSMSIRENIRWGGNSARIGEEVQEEASIVRAADLACLSPDLQMFPQGLDTPVGPRGITLSGGQRQRVTLARAFFRSFKLLILDDVLAAVDHHTERTLIRNIYSKGALPTGRADATEPSPLAGPALLMGEASSAVETFPGKDSGSSVQAGTFKTTQTTLIVSHRISALLHADHILVMDQGRLVDQGSHTELVHRPGTYASTWQAQQESGSEEAAYA